jgi:hypothetical protein
MRRGITIVAAAWLACAGPARAQHAGHADRGTPAQAAAGIRGGAQAIMLVTRAAPAVAGRTLTEGYVTQPMLHGHAWLGGGRLSFDGVLNLEGVTLRRGELNAGVWGEGYIDRRHPHTYLHEAVATVHGGAAGARVSLTAGRGFVPFGTDDPMARPFVKYPANHHLAQALERWVLVAAARAGPVTLEAALLNGDEPTSPTDLGRPGRFGDSRAARLTLHAPAGVELQASRADLASPEVASGDGRDQTKWSAAARWEGALALDVAAYALLEWARTDERDRVSAAFRFHSTLVEAQLRRAGASLALRVERTERPEEERGYDPFRSPPQHIGPLLGITRWTLASVRVAHEFGAAGARATPFVEATALRVTETTGSIFSPAEFYGAERQWQLSAGVRLDGGPRHARMGRYGAARGGEHHTETLDPPEA